MPGATPVTDLLPQATREAVSAVGTNAASVSFGVVGFVVLLVILIERDALSMWRGRTASNTLMTAVSLPLLVAVATVLVTRIYLLAR